MIGAAYPQANQRHYGYYRDLLQPLTFVLVHGSWADTTFWDGVAAELRKQGHTAYVPEYAGHGGYPTEGVTHAMITQSVVDFITAHQLKDIILVGHSFGGSVIQKVAEQVPDRLKRIVFLDAFVVNDGESVADQFPPQTKAAFTQLRKATKNDTLMLPFPIFRETFVNLADLSFAQQAYRRILPEPAKPVFEKLDLKKFYKLDTPRSYLYLTEDNVLPQGEGYGWHPHMSSRLGLFRLVKAPGDHFSAIINEPARIAQQLYIASRD